MQRVTPKIEDKFGPMERELRDAFIPDLFQSLGEGTLARGFTLLDVKQAGLALPDPTTPPPP